MTVHDIFNLIVKNTREVVPELGEHAFQPADRLRDLGANSIDRSEILIMTLEDISLAAPLVQFAGASSIGELAELIYAKAAVL
jgi:polyketide biosynthesis acyl carrier protein